MARKFAGISSIRSSAEEAVANLSAETIQEIFSDKITDSPFNKDLPMTDLDLLAESLKESNGPIEPIVVYDKGNGTYELLSGHRRRAAWCGLLGHKSIKARVRSYPKAQITRFKEHATANTATREKDPLFWIAEIAQAREVLKETGFTGNDAEEKEKIHELLGKGASPMQIARYDGFEKMVPEMQGLTKYGLSVGKIYYAAGLTEEEQRLLAGHIRTIYESDPESDLSREKFIELVNSLKHDRNHIDPTETNEASETPVKPPKKQTISTGSIYQAKGDKVRTSITKYILSAKSEEDQQLARDFLQELREMISELENGLS